MSPAQIALVARVCHEVERRLRVESSDVPAPPWSASPDWMVKEVIARVQFWIDIPYATFEEAHQAWYARRISQGWRYGGSYIPRLQQDPDLVAYDELDKDGQTRAVVFRAIVIEYAAAVRPSSIETPGAARKPDMFT